MVPPHQPPWSLCQPGLLCPRGTVRTTGQQDSPAASWHQPPAVTQTQDYTSCCAPGEGPIHRPKGSPRGTGQSAGKAALAQLCLAGFLRQADPGILASPIWPQETLGESPISPDFLHRPYYTCIAFLFLFFRRDTGYSEYYGNLHHRTTVNYRVL